ncbi:MAG: type II toxin-antitoxin system RelE/ParE family toxin [Calditrichaeota bacterium]|nr:MAG: type II toxin-antitoxin system RelE/ParE family toxin [Calditrichota bacterium]MBL1207444.1 type II toxin-antitoxin system RelE/ParE family toxin [Calditrichota bacterium]NOG47276.1 type II toxin-antitoxin system RelE/ParE family toxin [Calditrichota bacterium]
MRKIEFYRTENEDSPVERFLDSLNDKQAAKIAWVLRIVRDYERVSKEYFKKLVGTDDIWEIRIKFGRDIFRILCFFAKGKIIVLTNGFVKKSQKTPVSEIKLAEKRKKEYIERKK